MPLSPELLTKEAVKNSTIRIDGGLLTGSMLTPGEYVTGIISDPVDINLPEGYPRANRFGVKLPGSRAKYWVRMDVENAFFDRGLRRPAAADTTPKARDTTPKAEDARPVCCSRGMAGCPGGHASHHLPECDRRSTMRPRTPKTGPAKLPESDLLDSEIESSDAELDAGEFEDPLVQCTVDEHPCSLDGYPANIIKREENRVLVSWKGYQKSGVYSSSGLHPGSHHGRCGAWLPANSSRIVWPNRVSVGTQFSGARTPVRRSSAAEFATDDEHGSEETERVEEDLQPIPRSILKQPSEQATPSCGTVDKTNRASVRFGFTTTPTRSTPVPLERSAPLNVSSQYVVRCNCGVVHPTVRGATQYGCSVCLECGKIVTVQDQNTGLSWPPVPDHKTFERAFDPEANCMGLRFRTETAKGKRIHYTGVEISRQQGLAKIDFDDHGHLLGLGDEFQRVLDGGPVVKAGELTAAMLNTRFKGNYVPVSCLFKHENGTPYLTLINDVPSRTIATFKYGNKAACCIAMNLDRNGNKPVGTKWVLISQCDGLPARGMCWDTGNQHEADDLYDRIPFAELVPWLRKQPASHTAYLRYGLWDNAYTLTETWINRFGENVPSGAYVYWVDQADGVEGLVQALRNRYGIGVAADVINELPTRMQTEISDILLSSKPTSRSSTIRLPRYRSRSRSPSRSRSRSPSPSRSRRSRLPVPSRSRSRSPSPSRSRRSRSPVPSRSRSPDTGSDTEPESDTELESVLSVLDGFTPPKPRSLRSAQSKSRMNFDFSFKEKSGGKKVSKAMKELQTRINAVGALIEEVQGYIGQKDATWVRHRSEFFGALQAGMSELLTVCKVGFSGPHNDNNTLHFLESLASTMLRKNEVFELAMFLLGAGPHASTGKAVKPLRDCVRGKSKGIWLQPKAKKRANNMVAAWLRLATGMSDIPSPDDTAKWSAFVHSASFGFDIQTHILQDMVGDRAGFLTSTVVREVKDGLQEILADLGIEARMTRNVIRQFIGRFAKLGDGLCAEMTPKEGGSVPGKGNSGIMTDVKAVRNVGEHVSSDQAATGMLYGKGSFLDVITSENLIATKTKEPCSFRKVLIEDNPWTRVADDGCLGVLCSTAPVSKPADTTVAEFSAAIRHQLEVAGINICDVDMHKTVDHHRHRFSATDVSVVLHHASGKRDKHGMFVTFKSPVLLQKAISKLGVRPVFRSRIRFTGDGAAVGMGHVGFTLCGLTWLHPNLVETPDLIMPASVWPGSDCGGNLWKHAGQLGDQIRQLHDRDGSVDSNNDVYLHQFCLAADGALMVEALATPTHSSKAGHTPFSPARRVQTSPTFALLEKRPEHTIFWSPDVPVPKQVSHRLACATSASLKACCEVSETLGSETIFAPLRELKALLEKSSVQSFKTNCALKSRLLKESQEDAGNLKILSRFRRWLGCKLTGALYELDFQELVKVNHLHSNFDGVVNTLTGVSEASEDLTMLLDASFGATDLLRSTKSGSKTVQLQKVTGNCKNFVTKEVPRRINYVLKHYAVVGFQKALQNLTCRLKPIIGYMQYAISCESIVAQEQINDDDFCIHWSESSLTKTGCRHHDYMIRPHDVDFLCTRIYDVISDPEASASPGTAAATATAILSEIDDSETSTSNVESLCRLFGIAQGSVPFVVTPKDAATEIGHCIMRSVEKIVREDADYIFCQTATRDLMELWGTMTGHDVSYGETSKGKFTFHFVGGIAVHKVIQLCRDVMVLCELLVEEGYCELALVVKAKYTHLAAIYDICHVADDQIIDYFQFYDGCPSTWLDVPLEDSPWVDQNGHRNETFDRNSKSMRGFFEPGGAVAHQKRVDFILDLLTQLRILVALTSERINHVSSWVQLTLTMDQHWRDLEETGPGPNVCATQATEAKNKAMKNHWWPTMQHRLLSQRNRSSQMLNKGQGQFVALCRGRKLTQKVSGLRQTQSIRVCQLESDSAHSEKSLVPCAGMLRCGMLGLQYSTLKAATECINELLSFRDSTDCLQFVVTARDLYSLMPNGDFDPYGKQIRRSPAVFSSAVFSELYPSIIWFTETVELLAPAGKFNTGKTVASEWVHVHYARVADDARRVDDARLVPAERKLLQAMKRRISAEFKSVQRQILDAAQLWDVEAQHIRGMFEVPSLAQMCIADSTDGTHLFASSFCYRYVTVPVHLRPLQRLAMGSTGHLRSQRPTPSTGDFLQCYGDDVRCMGPRRLIARKDWRQEDLSWLECASLTQGNADIDDHVDAPSCFCSITEAWTARAGARELYQLVCYVTGDDIVQPANLQFGLVRGLTKDCVQVQPITPNAGRQATKRSSSTLELKTQLCGADSVIEVAPAEITLLNPAPLSLQDKSGDWYGAFLEKSKDRLAVSTEWIVAEVAATGLERPLGFQIRKKVEGCGAHSGPKISTTVPAPK